MREGLIKICLKQNYFGTALRSNLFLLFLDKSRNKWDKRRDHDDDDDHHDSKRNRGKEAAHERDWEVKRGKARESIRKDEQKGEWIFDRLVFNNTIFVEIL